jgi:hypothetical protein
VHICHYRDEIGAWYLWNVQEQSIGAAWCCCHMRFGYLRVNGTQYSLLTTMHLYDAGTMAVGRSQAWLKPAPMSTLACAPKYTLRRRGSDLPAHTIYQHILALTARILARMQHLFKDKCVTGA